MESVLSPLLLIPVYLLYIYSRARKKQNRLQFRSRNDF